MADESNAAVVGRDVGAFAEMSKQLDVRRETVELAARLALRHERDSDEDHEPGPDLAGNAESDVDADEEHLVGEWIQ